MSPQIADARPGRRRRRRDRRRPLAAAGRAPHPVPLQRAGALLLQRGPADPGEQQPADDAALPGRDRAGGHRATPTATTGAPRSPRSTCTARTRSWWSPATSIVEAGPDLAGHDRVGLERAARPGGAGAVRRAAHADAAAPPWTTTSWPRRATSSATPIRTRPAPLVCRFVARAHRVPVRLDQREDQRDAGLDQGQGRLPGHLARHRRPAARARAARPATSPATCTPSRTPRSASRSRARATPGWSGGTAAGTASTRPTPSTIGTRHVTLGRGRDYGDVPPFKGLFSGPKSEGHTVTVEVTRLA